MFVKTTGERKPPEPGATQAKNVAARAEFVGSTTLDDEKMHCGRQRLDDMPIRKAAIKIRGSEASKRFSIVKPINRRRNAAGII